MVSLDFTPIHQFSVRNILEREQCCYGSNVPWMGQQCRRFRRWLGHCQGWIFAMCILSRLCRTPALSARIRRTGLLRDLGNTFLWAYSDLYWKCRGGFVRQVGIWRAWVVSKTVFSVICCAMASFIPLVTRRFHADKVVAVSLIMCYIVALILSLLTGLEILWPPQRN